MSTFQVDMKHVMLYPSLHYRYPTFLIHYHLTKTKLKSKVIHSIFDIDFLQKHLSIFSVKLEKQRMSPEYFKSLILVLDILVENFAS